MYTVSHGHVFNWVLFVPLVRTKECWYVQTVTLYVQLYMYTVSHGHVFNWVLFVPLVRTKECWYVQTVDQKQLYVQALILYVQSRFFCSCKAVVRAIVRAKVFILSRCWYLYGTFLRTRILKNFRQECTSLLKQMFSPDIKKLDRFNLVDRYNAGHEKVHVSLSRF